MITHRFLAHLNALSPVAVSVQEHHDAAFVPCPVLALLTTSQQSRIMEIYRIAQEQTAKQLHPTRRLGIPEFSVN